jgi:hypothetical protein
MKATDDEPPVDTASDTQAMHTSNDLIVSEQLNQLPELLESSHVERVSSFVRQHRNSISQPKQAWISTNSILSFKERKTRTASYCSTNSVGPVNEERLLITGSPERAVCDSPEAIRPNIQIDISAPEYPADKYGKLLYRGEIGVEQINVIRILGKE